MPVTYHYQVFTYKQKLAIEAETATRSVETAERRLLVLLGVKI